MRPPNWVNPTPLDRYKFLIIGAGPAGLVAAHAAATLGAKVALVERELLGGDCLNVGCVPSKAIIRTAQLYAEMRKAQYYGAQVPADIRVDFAAVMIECVLFAPALAAAIQFSGWLRRGSTSFLVVGDSSVPIPLRSTARSCVSTRR